jgi:L-lysine 6-transaminase
VSITLTPQEVLPTLKKYMLADGYGDLVFDLERSKGAVIYDKLNDRELLDFFTCFASSPIGYNHPKLTAPDFLKKLARVAVNKPSNSDVYTTEMAEFVATWARIAMPDYMRHLFLVSGGGLAVENALKAAFDYKTRRNLEDGVWKDDAEAQAHENELVVIHFKQAFHGRTGYTLSLTNTADPRKYKYYPKFDWPRINSPGVNFSLPEPERWELCAEQEELAVEEIRAAMARHPHGVAAIIIEPIQAEGGDRHFRFEFHRKLRELADEADALLIHDEVQTGFGLTGKFWASEHLGIRPDILAFGKKSQVCGIMAGEKVDRVKYNVFSAEKAPDGTVPGCSRLNSTWGGNLVDMVRCQAYGQLPPRRTPLGRRGDGGHRSAGPGPDDSLRDAHGRGTGQGLEGDVRPRAVRHHLRGALHPLPAAVEPDGGRGGPGARHRPPGAEIALGFGVFSSLSDPWVPRPDGCPAATGRS